MTLTAISKVGKDWASSWSCLEMISGVTLGITASMYPMSPAREHHSPTKNSLVAARSLSAISGLTDFPVIKT